MNNTTTNTIKNPEISEVEDLRFRILDHLLDTFIPISDQKRIGYKREEIFKYSEDELLKSISSLQKLEEEFKNPTHEPYIKVDEYSLKFFEQKELRKKSQPDFSVSDFIGEKQYTIQELKNLNIHLDKFEISQDMDLIKDPEFINSLLIELNNGFDQIRREEK
jgi:hypothetical protein